MVGSPACLGTAFVAHLKGTWITLESEDDAGMVFVNLEIVTHRLTQGNTRISYDDSSESSQMMDGVNEMAISVGNEHDLNRIILI